MGERESSIVNTKDSFEDESDINSVEEQEYDPNLAAAHEYCKRIVPLDDRFNEGKINRDEYFIQLEKLRDKTLEQNENYPEDKEIINLIYDGSLSIHSACKRFKLNVERTRKDSLAMAVIEAKWQIQMARYFHSCKEQSTTVAMTKLFLNRMKDTYKTLNFDDKYIEGIMRGVKGLIATSLAMDKNDHSIIWPESDEELEEFAEEDAKLKTDLKTMGSDGIRYFWQLKTEAIDRNPLVMEITKKIPFDPNNKKFVRDANILFDHAKEAEARDSLTTKAMYVIVPEPQISDKFVPNKETISSLK